MALTQGQLDAFQQRALALTLVDWDGMSYDEVIASLREDRYKLPTDHRVYVADCYEGLDGYELAEKIEQIVDAFKDFFGPDKESN